MVHGIDNKQKLTVMSVKGDFNDKTELEILQERAEVLGRAGEALSQALENLKIIEMRIRAAMTSEVVSAASDHVLNLEIQQFNKVREHAKLRYYYLIVIREAMGFRKHAVVEEAYPIPPQIKPLMRMEWSGSKDRE